MTKQKLSEFGQQQADQAALAKKETARYDACKNAVEPTDAARPTTHEGTAARRRAYREGRLRSQVQEDNRKEKIRIEKQRIADEKAAAEERARAEKEQAEQREREAAALAEADANPDSTEAAKLAEDTTDKADPEPDAGDKIVEQTETSADGPAADADADDLLEEKTGEAIGEPRTEVEGDELVEGDAQVEDPTAEEQAPSETPPTESSDPAPSDDAGDGDDALPEAVAEGEQLLE